MNQDFKNYIEKEYNMALIREFVYQTNLILHKDTVNKYNNLHRRTKNEAKSTNQRST